MEINFVSEFFSEDFNRFTIIGVQFNDIPETDNYKFIGFDYKLSINIWFLGFGVQILIKR